MRKDKSLAARRKRRNRYNLRQRSRARAGLSVFRASRHIAARSVIDSVGLIEAAAAILVEEKRLCHKTHVSKAA